MYVELKHIFSLDKTIVNPVQATKADGKKVTTFDCPHLTKATVTNDEQPSVVPYAISM